MSDPTPFPVEPAPSVETPAAPTTHQAPKPKTSPLLIGTAIVALIALLASLALTGLYVSAKGDLDTKTAELAEATTALDAATDRIQDAESEADSWENVAENWRLCGVALLETVDSLVNDDLYGGLADIGAARGKCETARTSQDAASGGFGSA